jgi:hypothetical protein
MCTTPNATTFYTKLIQNNNVNIQLGLLAEYQVSNQHHWKLMNISYLISYISSLELLIIYFDQYSAPYTYTEIS